MPAPRFAILLLAASFAAIPAAARSEAVRVPGTPVVMEPPPGFKAEEKFPGFGKAEDMASIMVTALPVAADKVRPGFTSAALAERGTPLLGEEAVTVDGQSTTLYRVSQQAAGREFRKWILLLDGQESALLIVGTFPASSEQALSGPIRAALLTTRLAAPAADPLEGMPFRVQPSSRLRLATRVGNTLLFTETGQIKGGAEDPLLVVGAAISDVAIADLEAFARARAARTDQVSGLSGLSGRALQVDGLAGYELVGDAADKGTGAPLRFYQLVLHDGATYYLAQGLVGAARGTEFVEEFRRVATSFDR